MTNKPDTTSTAAPATEALQFRPLAPTDGMALHQLVGACPPLDTNSAYCNLLQCSHFSDTSIAAFRNEALMGSVTGYRIPGREDTLFIWQVAVHPEARGQGLARTMLRKLVSRMAAQGVRYIETSITPGNEASWRLFTGFAAERQAKLERSVLFEQTLHFQGAHDTENLVRIGPVYDG